MLLTQIKLLPPPMEVIFHYKWNNGFAFRKFTSNKKNIKYLSAFYYVF